MRASFVDQFRESVSKKQSRYFRSNVCWCFDRTWVGVHQKRVNIKT